MKTLKGDKYIYYAMAYRLAKENGGSVIMGDDNNIVGGQNYYRKFSISTAIDEMYRGDVLLIETKTNKSFADFSRAFRVVHMSKRPIITEYVVGGENCSTKWVH